MKRLLLIIGLLITVVFTGFAEWKASWPAKIIPAKDGVFPDTILAMVASNKESNMVTLVVVYKQDTPTRKQLMALARYLIGQYEQAYNEVNIAILSPEAFEKCAKPGEEHPQDIQNYCTVIAKHNEENGIDSVQYIPYDERKH